MELSQLIINQETFSIRALVETHRRVKRVAPCYPMSMDDFYGQDLAFVHAEAFEALAVSAAETLLQFLGRGAPSRRVLDLGCGAGPLSRRLSEKGFSTWGLDLSPALIAVARERLPGAEFQCGSIHDARLPKAAAAAAVGEVLNYATAHDPAALSGVFARVFKALAPGGVFLFDLAGPGRVGAGRSFTEGANWAVGLVATESSDQLLRKISTFREVDEGVRCRSYEEHRLRLWPAASVVERLRACGFRAQELPGYSGATMPPSLHVYLAIKPSWRQKYAPSERSLSGCRAPRARRAENALCKNGKAAEKQQCSAPKGRKPGQLDQCCDCRNQDQREHREVAIVDKQPDQFVEG